ncbi:helix-turn-helix domain-containing protein [Streptomyces yatensis]|uniref:helix-turn-helix domain-containing protein n=1 Tax=Streptomyces yatensis TaxID=155177 RepID=UPI0031BA2607
MGNAKEVEDFAERLRALKERSGRSYGSLATRLHVSTSTLHRYCNGDAVPAEYASVERFARLCGASPEELLALHRRWILADASRHRAREADREGAGGRAAANGTVSAPRGGAADRPAADGTPRKADPRTADGPARETDVRSTDGTGREAERESAGGRPAADGPAPEPDADARGGDGEPRPSADAREGDDDSSDNSATPAATPGARPNAGRHQGRVAASGPDPVTGTPPGAAAPSGPARDGTGPEAGGRSHDARPYAAADARQGTIDERQSTAEERHNTAEERHDTAEERRGTATPADASRATPTWYGAPAAHRTAAATDPSSDGHGAARRGGAAQQDGNPGNHHQRGDTGDTTEHAGDGRAPSAAAGQAQPHAAPTDKTAPTANAQSAPAGNTQSAPTGNTRSAHPGNTRPTPTANATSAATARRRLRAVSGSDGGTAVVSRARRPWALLAGAAAVVVLAVTAVEVRPPGEDGRKDAAASPPSAAPSSTPRTGPTARGHLDRQKTDGDDASGAPRGDDKDGKGERGKGQRANGGASGSPAPGSSKGPGGGGSTQVPLTLSTRSHVWENGCGHRYLIDRSPSQVAPPPTEQDAPTWAAAHGAVHGGTTNVEVTVQGRASSAVVLQALHVRVVGRRTPLAWSSFAMDNGCGGSLTPRAFSVNLDAARPLARPTEGNDAGKPIPAVHFPYRVSASDPEVLLVNARTAGCDCSWYLELDWSSGGRSGTLRIDDHGSPFRTSSIKGRPQYAYDYTDGSWHTSELSD